GDDNVTKDFLSGLKYENFISGISFSPGVLGTIRYSKIFLPDIRPFLLIFSETFGSYFSTPGGRFISFISRSLILPVPLISTFKLTGSFVLVSSLSSDVVNLKSPTAPVNDSGLSSGSGITLIVNVFDFAR